MPLAALLHDRIRDGKMRCDFLIQGHRSAYEDNYPTHIIVGRPFFERFYTVFNYTDGDMNMRVGARNINHYKYEVEVPFEYFDGNTVTLVLCLFFIAVFGAIFYLMIRNK